DGSVAAAAVPVLNSFDGAHRSNFGSVASVTRMAATLTPANADTVPSMARSFLLLRRRIFLLLLYGSIYLRPARSYLMHRKKPDRGPPDHYLGSNPQVRRNGLSMQDKTAAGGPPENRLGADWRRSHLQKTARAGLSWPSTACFDASPPERM